MSKHNLLPKSFGYAFQGFQTAFRNEPNFRIHTLAALTVLTLAIIFRFNLTEWTILLFTISFVIIMELFNTAIESIVNLVSPEIKPYAKIAKDVSAAAVLLAAGVSIVIGVLLFLPKLLWPDTSLF